MKLKIPPVAVTLIFGGIVWFIDYFLPNETLNFNYRNWLISVLIITGTSIAILGVIEFRRKKTTVNPQKPQNTSNMVDTGIYRLSRNPMYLGLLLILCGWILYSDNIYTLLIVPLFIWYMNIFQIIPEEKVMQEKFGIDYLNYKNEVRRWF